MIGAMRVTEDDPFAPSLWRLHGGYHPPSWLMPAAKIPLPLRFDAFAWVDFFKKKTGGIKFSAR
jgi:hypothetical protein